MSPTNNNNERLTHLLFTLPPELRFTIYELSLPFLQHRRSKVLADYISDSHWMALSPLIFHDAAPLIFRKRLVYIYTRLGAGTTLIQTFDDILTRSYPRDHEWILPVARSMLRKLALTIMFPHLRLVGVADDLEAYLTRISSFTGLEELHISLGPEFLPAGTLDRPTMATGYDREELSASLASLTSSESIRMLEAIAAVKRCVRPECRVIWSFDRAAMPSLPRGCSVSGTLEELTYFNEVMAWMWEHGVSLSREAG